MLSNSEKKMVDHYLVQMTDAEIKRREIVEQIKRLESAVRGILALTDDEDELAEYLERLDQIVQVTGFTDAIRRVLQNTDEGLTPPEIKQKMITLNFAFAGYSNPLASIHTILKRLMKSDEVVAVAKDGKTAYRWKNAEERFMDYIQRPKANKPLREFKLDKK